MVDLAEAREQLPLVVQHQAAGQQIKVTTVVLVEHHQIFVVVAAVAREVLVAQRQHQPVATVAPESHLVLLEVLLLAVVVAAVVGISLEQREPHLVVVALEATMGEIQRMERLILAVVGVAVVLLCLPVQVMAAMAVKA